MSWESVLGSRLAGEVMGAKDVKNATDRFLVVFASVAARAQQYHTAAGERRTAAADAFRFRP